MFNLRNSNKISKQDEAPQRPSAPLGNSTAYHRGSQKVSRGICPGGSRYGGKVEKELIWLKILCPKYIRKGT